MKTLKKTLCLVLAVVMAVGVLVIPANAATNFPDDADITHDEAVAVLNSLGIFEGDDKGNFNPDTVLKRAEAAKIIAVLMQGKEAADDYVPSTVPFTDIADYAGGWAVNYIAYCADNGIIGGNGDGTFNPDGDLTGHAFAKMLLCALGYDGNNEGFGGSNWTSNVESIARSAKVKLNNGISSFSYTAPLTRDKAAQMAYNALKVKRVTGYTGGTEIQLPGGVSITQGAERNEDGGTLEDAFDIKKLEDADMDLDAADAYKHPMSYQIAIGDEVVYVKNVPAAATFTASTSQSAVDKALKGYTISKVTPDAYGCTENTVVSNDEDNTAVKNLTKNGRVVEIYADEDKNVTDIIVIQPQLAKINSKSSSRINLKTGDNLGSNVYANSDTSKDNSDWYDVLDAYETGDYVAIVLREGEIYDVEAVELVTGKLTAKGKTSGDHAASYTIDGKSYKPAAGAQKVFSSGEPKLSADDDCTAVIYGGNLVLDFVEAAGTEDDSVNVIFLVATYSTFDEYSQETIMFQGVLPNGEVITDVVGDKTKVEPGQGGAYTYTVEKGKYMFTACKEDVKKNMTEGAYKVNETIKVTTSSTRLGTYNYFGGDVKFIQVKDSLGSLEVTPKDGRQNITLSAGDVVVVTKDANGNAVVSAVYVTAGKYATPTVPGDELLFFPAKATPTGSTLDEEGNSINTFDAYLNGEKVEIYSSKDSIEAGWYPYSITESTGEYNILDNKDVSAAAGVTDVEIAYIDGVYYMSSTTAKIPDYDASDAVIVDLDTKAENEITSVADLMARIAAANVGTVQVSFAYDGDAETVDVIYVISQGTVSED